ncbi:group 10 secretory phospholipase A2-like isoform X2 [Cervus elaphus]|uniref:group 10 secretory phospholipase A2-like isoform X2 n=1 Tax=Cervus elaphus TaxID=9860 RepID=UPI001CC31002|nr:group 10 secretory phospholipase A2-like isoform X2 [Cervus elaphus]
MAPLPLCPTVGLLLLLLLGSGPGLRAAPQRSHVHRRGLLGLAGAIDCVGPRPALVYLNYGCFCGLGGHGQPQDAIDWCCHAHDCCYTHAENYGCNPKLQPYSWNCVNQRVMCDLCMCKRTNKNKYQDFPGVPVVKNLPANAGDASSIPDPGRSHRPWSS